MTDDADLKRREEEKRDRVMAKNPAERWARIQATITWAEANMKPEFHRNRPRVPKVLPPREK